MTKGLKLLICLIMDLTTDSDAIMKDTQAIPSCIATIKHLLISRVIKKR